VQCQLLGQEEAVASRAVAMLRAWKTSTERDFRAHTCKTWKADDNLVYEREDVFGAAFDQRLN
jgi:hypothetical protein